MSGKIPVDTEPTSIANPQPVMMVYAQEPEARVDLIRLVVQLWKRKPLIFVISAGFAAVGVLYALLMTPVYRAEVVLIPNQTEQSGNLPSGLGGLASLTGISLGVSADTTEAVATLRSSVFAEEFIIEHDLLPVLFSDKWDSTNERWFGDDPEEWPDIRDGITYFTEEIRKVDEDAATGLVTLAIVWVDPEVAANWAEDLVRRINDRLRTRALEESERRLTYLNEQLKQANLVELRLSISHLIENEIQTVTLANAETEFAFKIIDPARVPKAPAAPKRILIILAAILLGGIIGVVVAGALEWSSVRVNRSAVKSQA